MTDATDDGPAATLRLETFTYRIEWIDRDRRRDRR
jgi:hypothetical protein